MVGSSWRFVDPTNHEPFAKEPVTGHPQNCMAPPRPVPPGGPLRLVEAEGSHPFRFCTQPRIHRIPNCDLHQDALLETAAYRSAPMDCGPNVDQARDAANRLAWIRRLVRVTGPARPGRPTCGLPDDRAAIACRLVGPATPHRAAAEIGQLNLRSLRRYRSGADRKLLPGLARFSSCGQARLCSCLISSPS